MSITVFCDGGCSGNGKIDSKGSYGFIILKNKEKIYEKSEGFRNVTNNQMELKGIIKSLEYLNSSNFKNNEIKIFSDSGYCVDGLNSWIINWKKNNWMRGKKLREPVLNSDLWKELDVLYSSFSNISISWIKSHQNLNNWNDYVDSLCSQSIKNLNYE